MINKNFSCSVALDNDYDDPPQDLCSKSLLKSRLCRPMWISVSINRRLLDDRRVAVPPMLYHRSIPRQCCICQLCLRPDLVTEREGHLDHSSHPTAWEYKHTCQGCPPRPAPPCEKLTVDSKIKTSYPFSLSPHILSQRRKELFI